MGKKILGWTELYQSKCKEITELKAEIELLQKILHSYLEVVDGQDPKDNKNREIPGD